MTEKRTRTISAECAYQVMGRHRGRPFCAGVVAVNNMVVRAAPILHRRGFDLVLRSIWEAEHLCQRSGLTWERVTPSDTHTRQSPNGSQ